MTQVDGKVYCAHRLEQLLLLKWWYYPGQSMDSMQSLSKYQWHFFTKLEQVVQKLMWKHKKTLKSQTNLEKEGQSQRYQSPWFQTIVQNYSHQNSIILAQKQTHRSMEERAQKLIHTYMINWSTTKEAIIYNWKRQSLQKMVLV